jgi:predicted nucleic acid-binding protein
MKLLIDTNIILDAMMQREPWAGPAQTVMLAIAQEKAEGCMTANTFTDIHYMLRKHLKNTEKTKQALLVDGLVWSAGSGRTSIPPPWR